MRLNLTQLVSSAIVQAVSAAAIAVASTLSVAILGWPADTFWAMTALGFIAVLSILCYHDSPKAVSTAHSIVDASGNEIRPARRRHLRLFYISSIIVIVVGYSSIAFCFRDAFFPLAVIDTIEGSEIDCNENGFCLNHGSMPIQLQNDEEALAFRAMSINLRKTARSLPIRVLNLRCHVEPVFATATVHHGVFPSEFVKAHFFVAELSPNAPVSKGILHHEGNLAPGVLVFARDQVFEQIHVQFNADSDAEDLDGLYRVSVELELDDESGWRKQTLRSEGNIYIYVPATTWNDDEAP